MTQHFTIDGIKVRGSTNLPKSAIEEVSVMTGGVQLILEMQLEVLSLLQLEELLEPILEALR